MPLRPLASPLKIGVDICQIERIRKIAIGNGIVRTENGVVHRLLTPFHDLKGVSQMTNKRLHAMNVHLHPLFLNRLFREEEIQFFFGFWRGVQGKPDAHQRLFPHLAGRWAAKEAIIKVASSFFDLGPEAKLSLRDIIIWPGRSGRPQAAIIGKQRKGVTSTAAANVTSRDMPERDTDPFTSLNDQEATMSTSIEAPAMSEQLSEIDVVEKRHANRHANFTNILEHLDGDMVEIGISHEKDYAVATALFC